jgi:hypothetical protein
MDFSFDFDLISMYNPSDYNYQLKDKINELEKYIKKYKEDTTTNHQVSSINIVGILEQIKIHEDRLNRHHQYCEKIINKINELIVMINNLNQEKQISELREIIQKQKNKHDSDIKNIIKKQQDKYDFDIKNILQKQTEQELQIIKLQELMKIHEEKQEIIEKKEDKLKKIIEKQEDKPKKRNFDDITNYYIERLTLTKKRSNPWSDGMSKYISITIVNDRWRWESNIFDENHINFKSKEDAEKHFETIISKYNIDPIHITRI